MKQFSDLVGQTLANVESDGDEIIFTLGNGDRYHLFHSQECCESVTVDDIAGDLKDLIGSPITQAEESKSNENPAGVTKDCQDSFTWTFYKLATVRGYVTIRFYGESNGYYSESVDFGKLGGAAV